jgi:formamidopyrimidine-DNA glycosylase
MPELPEVETVMRGLQAQLEGRRIIRASVNRAGMRFPFPPGLAAALTGAVVTGFRRRAKYLLMRLEGGQSVLIHLGMSGRMLIERTGRNAIPAHEHLTLETEDGVVVGFVDPRRFGSVDLVATADEDAHRLLAGLGPEPLEPGFDAKLLGRALDGRRTPIKAALLDQRNVAGLGNIYVCEALFRAGVAPARLARDVTRPEVGRLVREIKATLGEAIAAGGSSLRDYVQPDGELGYFQHAWKVYGREGAPCPDCPGAPGCGGVVRVVQSGRSSFYCPRRQR